MLKLLVLPEMIFLKVGTLFDHLVMTNSEILVTGFCLKLKEVSVATLKRNDFALL